jgi:hypothetical protein
MYWNGSNWISVPAAGTISWTTISPAQITADQSDYSPTGFSTCTHMRLNSDAQRSIRSLATRSDGTEITISNVGSFNIILEDEYTTGTTAAQRFALNGAMTIYPDGVLRLVYDNTTARWRAITEATATINDLAAETSPATDDKLALWDTSAGTTDKINLSVLETFFFDAPVFGAGSASANSKPKLTVGTLLTTPEVGAIEIDANCMYGCTDAGNRGILPLVHVIRADGTRTLTSQTATQPIFNSPANGRITLETGVYEFEGLICIASMSATSGNATFDITGTATFGSVLWFGTGRDAAADAATGTLAGSHSRDATLVAAPLVTAATTTEMFAFLKGTFEVTAAGTVIFGVALQTAAAAIVQIGSYIKLARLGSTSMVSVGQWD